MWDRLEKMDLKRLLEEFRAAPLYRAAVFAISLRFKLVDAAGVEPASLIGKPAATTCLVRKRFSTSR